MANARCTVVNHNIGGGSTQGTGLYSTGLAPLGTTWRVIQDHWADALTLQEVYESEFELWRSHGWQGVFVPMTEANENPKPERRGQAILSPYAILDSHIEPLGAEGVKTGKEFNLLCAAIDHPGFRGKTDTLWIATTHLWAQGHDMDGNLYSGTVNDSVRLSQANKIAAYLNPRIGYARKYVLTGDFNTNPKSLPINQIHRVNQNGTIGTAKFWEGDQSHNGTFGDGNLGRGGRDTVVGRKIDYWFGSYSGANPHEAGIDMALHGCSTNGGVPHEEIMRGWINWTDVQ